MATQNICHCNLSMLGRWQFCMIVPGPDLASLPSCVCCRRINMPSGWLPVSWHQRAKPWQIAPTSQKSSTFFHFWGWKTGIQRLPWPPVLKTWTWTRNVLCHPGVQKNTSLNRYCWFCWGNGLQCILSFSEIKWGIKIIEAVIMKNQLMGKFDYRLGIRWY